MTVKLEVTITDEGSMSAVRISKSGGGTLNEKAHLTAIVSAIRAIALASVEPTPGCSCPSCSGRREANHVRQNMH